MESHRKYTTFLEKENQQLKEENQQIKDLIEK
jgi:cell shape-determining protein MreC